MYDCVRAFVYTCQSHLKMLKSLRVHIKISQTRECQKFMCARKINHIPLIVHLWCKAVLCTHLNCKYVSYTGPLVGFQQIQYVADEEMVPGQIRVCVELFSSGPHPTPITVSLSTMDGSATGTTTTRDTHTHTHTLTHTLTLTNSHTHTHTYVYTLL